MDDLLNQRCLGSGIFVTPAILLKATGSPGASLLLWMLGAITGICALLIWLEFGLSTPKYWVPNRHADDSLAEGESLQCVPRSGGEKNYVSSNAYLVPRKSSLLMIRYSSNTFTARPQLGNCGLRACMVSSTSLW